MLEKLVIAVTVRQVALIAGILVKTAERRTINGKVDR
jgi:hypothetical protein